MKINFKSSQLNEMYFEQSNSFYWDLKSKVIKHYFKKCVSKDSNVLDIGCGTGFIAANLDLYPKKYTGQDVFPESEFFLRRNLGNECFFTNKSIDMLDKNYYQTILLLDVIEHINEDVEFLKIINSLLMDKGILILTTPAHQWLFSQLDKEAGHVRRYSHTELDEKLKLAGFKRVYLSSFLILTLPFQIISRLLLDKSKINGFREHSSWINKFLKLLNTVDLLLCRSNLFKIGGTLVVVYEK